MSIVLLAAGGRRLMLHRLDVPADIQQGGMPVYQQPSTLAALSSRRQFTRTDYTTVAALPL